jgi:hypothetical protein
MNEQNTQAQTVKLDGLVRPLEWEWPCRANNNTHIARSIFGEYYVDVDGGRHQAWLLANDAPYERLLGDSCGCLFIAQSAAQADYTARILAALDTDAIAALVEALQQCKENASGGAWVPSSVICAIVDTALARLGGGE